MLFKPRDEKNQVVLDKIRDEFIDKGIEYILKLSDYGNTMVELNGDKYSYVWWNYKFGNSLSHIIFQIDQKTFLGYYKFLSGIKILDNSIYIMTSDELANYD